MKRRKEETGTEREESETKMGHRSLHLFSVSFFQTLSLSPSLSLSTFCVSNSFSALLAFLPAFLSVLVSYSQFPCMSLQGLNLFSSLSLSQSLKLSLTPFFQVFSSLPHQSLFLSLVCPSTLCLLRVSIFFRTSSLPLCLSSLCSSLLSSAAFLSRLKQRERDKTKQIGK